jgi:hypothetical protein
MERTVSAKALVVIPLPTDSITITYAVARLVQDGDRVFAEAIVAIPGTVFAPPGRMSLSPHSLMLLREGSPRRPALYFYEGMIMPPP